MNGVFLKCEELRIEKLFHYIDLSNSYHLDMSFLNGWTISGLVVCKEQAHFLVNFQYHLLRSPSFEICFHSHLHHWD